MAFQNFFAAVKDSFVVRAAEEEEEEELVDPQEVFTNATIRQLIP